MGRKKGSVNKKTYQSIEDTPDEPYNIIEDVPEKDLYRINEAADYFNVSEESIRLWIDHGHLELEIEKGIRKVTWDSMLACQFNGHFKTLPKKEYLRPDEVADYFRLSVKTIYGWIDEGKLEAVKIGPSKTIRIIREVVENMVKPIE